MVMAALVFGSMGVMQIVLAAATGDAAAPALRIVCRRLVDMQRLLCILMGSSGAALPNGRLRLARGRHRVAPLAILLIALVGGVLLDVAGVALLIGVAGDPLAL